VRLRDADRSLGDQRRQERASSWTHGVAAALSVAALVLMIVRSADQGSARSLVSACVFGAGLLLLYLASTLLHALTGRAKAVFARLDFAGIFILIAGSYTPFTLLTLHGPFGWALFSTIWALAVLGVFLMVVYYKVFERAAPFIFLAMGWLITVAIRPLAQALPPTGLAFLVAGGLAYSLGVFFYLWHRWLYHHAIWHLFVIAGSVFHFLAIWRYVLPDVPH